MRLSSIEKKGLKYSLAEVNGEVFLFGSRLDNSKKGGDIDLLIIPDDQIINSVRMTIKIQAKFYSICEQKLDVVIFRDTPFCRQILKQAKKLNAKDFD